MKSRMASARSDKASWRWSGPALRLPGAARLTGEDFTFGKARGGKIKRQGTQTPALQCEGAHRQGRCLQQVGIEKFRAGERFVRRTEQTCQPAREARGERQDEQHAQHVEQGVESGEPARRVIHQMRAVQHAFGGPQKQWQQGQRRERRHRIERDMGHRHAPRGRCRADGRQQRGGGGADIGADHGRRRQRQRHSAARARRQGDGDGGAGGLGERGQQRANENKHRDGEYPGLLQVEGRDLRGKAGKGLLQQADAEEKQAEARNRLRRAAKPGAGFER